ncbi:hypothetical protein L873DRAFT_1787237 [Choiromyces venosus 120613-1]|uniref:GIT Spa2 homology (SHD) domain-containing protein n=1 Tax=Choiromyces venosus 120613-1 TaxID=1336337 RepID=A0A3N4K3X1_9PEZI|nr:hypothetical protein L873DRAFT_1787237 [Choiromyces venosus 120613-1]
MNSNGNIPRSALSPVSVTGSDWSGISGYQNRASDQLYGAPPPRSGSLANGDGMGPPGQRQNVSPPSSIARSSDGAGLYAQSDASSLKDIIHEEEVAAHHSALRKLLQPYLSQPGGARPNKARDKLLRLSVVQFQELSTDVYDELQRREGVDASASSGSPDKPPPFLLPKEKFHPKRNQARQKLSSLAAPRFRDLATDVFFELERRYPKFATELTRERSPTNSMDGRGMAPPGRLGSPGPGRVGSPGPGRVGSPGPPGRMGSPGPGQMRGPPGTPGGYGLGPNGMPRMGPGGPPRNGPPGGLGPPGTEGSGSPNRGEGPNPFGRPLPKTFQAGTVIPNKSTMIEDEDDDDDEGGAFGLEDSNRKPNGNRNGPASPGIRRDSNRSTGSMINGGSSEVDKKLIAEYQNKVEMLQDKIVRLEASLEDQGQEIAKLKGEERREESGHNRDREEWENLKHDLEEKLANAENLNQNLQNELSRVKADKSANERSLKDQLRDSQQTLGSASDRKYEDLLRQHEELKTELREQEEVTEEVRREAMEFLNQMKSISERADDSFGREERLTSEIEELQGELKEWKTRYARTKATLRSLRTSSMGLALQSPTSLISKEGGLSDPNGLVKDVHVTKFQISIDELLRTARGVNYSQTLEYVKAVVMATRSITEDIDESKTHNDDRLKLKSRVSATANNLTTAAKNHATSGGLSPVSLVDAAASHLTASIVELIKIVKIRPTPQGELEDDGEDLITSPGSAYEVDHAASVGMVAQKTNWVAKGQAGSRISGDSVYSPLSSPKHSRDRSRNGSLGGKGQWGSQPGSARSPDFAGKPVESNVEELRILLETQMEGIVESIQSLLTAIRADGDMQTLRKHVDDITTVVWKVLQSTENSMQQPGNGTLRDRGGWIVANLSKCIQSMGDLSNEGEPIDGPAGREFGGRLASLAFDLVRETKDLVRTVEEIDNESRGEAQLINQMMMNDDSLR